MESDRLTLAGPAEPVSNTDLELALRDPRMSSLDVLSFNDRMGVVLEGRENALDMLRRSGIRLTLPTDWLQFRSPTGQVTCFLCDWGCERAQDVWGIEQFDVEKDPRRIDDEDGSFGYMQLGSGRCKITQRTVEHVLGVRTSLDDNCRGLRGVALKAMVMKNCRANLDGSIARDLMGLHNVPIELIAECWVGQPKKRIEDIPKGRGFGAGDTRFGAAPSELENVTPPTCTVCKTAAGEPLPLKFRKGAAGRAPFWGCVNYEKHPQQRVIVDAEKWAAQQRAENSQIDREIAEREGQSR